MICIYHNSDFDGVCSAAIVINEFPECKLYGMNYGDDFDLDRIEQDEEVIMVDFYVGPSDFSNMNLIKERSDGGFTWIDHHKSQIECAKDAKFYADGGILEIGKAACELTWEFFFPLYKIPPAVSLLGRYDVFDHKDPNTLPFQYGMRVQDNSMSPEDQIWDDVLNSKNYQEEFIEGIVEQGKIIIEYEDQQNVKLIKECSFKIELDGYKGLAVNKALSNSKVFDSVSGFDFYSLFSRRSNGTWTVSLYSETIDVSILAKKRGGGGHKGAAGFVCKEFPF